MNKFKRLLALGLVTATLVSALSLTGCAGDGGKKKNVTMEDGKRVIQVGTWFDYYYTSEHTSIFDDPSLTLENSGGDEAEFEIDKSLAEKRLANTRRVEEKYNCKIKFVNLTFNGTIDSINTSVLAGNNDCDIYEIQADFGIPAIANGYAANLKDYLPADSDIFTDQVVLTYIDLSSVKEGVYMFKRNAAEDKIANTYMLAYNKTMLQQYGCEDPYTLWKDGKWTWDKWMEIMKTVVDDTDGDNLIDQFGFDSGANLLFSGLLMSNGATIASGKNQTLDSQPTLEVLNFLNKMYNEEKVAHPWVAYIEDGEKWETQMYRYTGGNVAFWIDACWISQEQKDAEQNFEIVWVPFPVGPSGNESTNAHKSLGTDSGYMIPVCAEDPAFIYNVFYDWCNWYNFDTELRDSRLVWWHNMALSEQNYDVMVYNSTPYSADLWNAVPDFKDMNCTQILTGELTPAQLVETYKNVIQDYLDTLIAK